MSVSAMRSVLRPHTLSSLSPAHQSSTTYICIPCRHARLLRRPKRPYTFTQLVALSDGSAFMLRTTSPQPVYRSTRDTRNAPLWNPSSKELMNVEDDEAGRLAGFRARFGTQFDAVRESATSEGEENVPKPTATEAKATDSTEPKDVEALKQRSKNVQAPQESDEWQYDFEEDDANLLDLISSYGQQGSEQSLNSAPEPSGKKGGKGKK